jgi:lipopolysaccharide transport system permease protein
MSSLGKDASLSALFAAGVRDIAEGARNWRVWYLMGSGDMRRRFERSRLGPLWIAITTGIMVTAIGIVWSTLWGANVAQTLPFIAFSMVSWQFLQGAISDASGCFPAYSGYFSNQYMAPSNVLYAVIYRNLITYLINLCVPIVVCVVFQTPVGFGALLLAPALAMQILFAFALAYIVAIVCARFRDVVQIVQNVMQLAFFTTPILWQPDILPDEARRWLIYNPFASLIEIGRAPMIGAPVSGAAWMAAAVFVAAVLAIAFPLIGRARRRIVYWL